MRGLRRLPRWIQALTLFLVAYFAADVVTRGWMLAFHYWCSSVDPSMLAMRERVMRASLHETVLHTHRWVLGIAAVIYGFKRGSHNHPTRVPGYKEWLRATPWQAPMPLPLGPPTFQWWDTLVVVVALGLNQWNAGLPWEALILAGCTAYAFGTLFMLMGTGRKWEAYAVAFGLSLMLWSAPYMTILLALSVVMTAIAHEGLRRSLYGFPWDGPPKPPAEEPWPMPIYDNIDPRIPLQTAVLTVVLLTSWLGGLVHFFNLRPTTVAFMSAVFCLLSCLIRLTIYCGNYKPPLTLLARIWQFRWIVPGYDRALIVPLAGAALAVGLPIQLYQSRFPAPAIAVIAIGATLLLLFTGGPTLRVWQLTGYHCFSKQETKRATAKT